MKTLCGYMVGKNITDFIGRSQSVPAKPQKLDGLKKRPLTLPLTRQERR